MDNKNIKEKIQKLLALASNNQNMEERQSAFVKAQELMVKYNVFVEEKYQTQEKEEITEALFYESYRDNWWIIKLSHIIIRNFKVLSYRSATTSINPFNNRRATLKGWYFFGRKTDVEVAVLVFNDIVNLINYNTKQYKLTRDDKKSYILGFLDGLSSKFKKQLEENETWTLALIVDEETKDEFNKQVTGTLTAPRVKTNKLNLDLYDKGFEQGEKYSQKRKHLEQ